MAFINEITEDGRYITVDREEGILLTYKGGVAAEPIYHFDFARAGKNFSIRAAKNIAFHEGGRSIRWTVNRVFPDFSFDENFEDIQSDLVAALTCYGAFGAAEKHPEKNKEINVEFSI